MQISVKFLYSHSGTVHVCEITADVLPMDDERTVISDLCSRIAQLGGRTIVGLTGQQPPINQPLERHPARGSTPTQGDAPLCPAHQSPMLLSKFQNKPGQVQYYCPVQDDNGHYCNLTANVSPTGVAFGTRTRRR